MFETLNNGANKTLLNFCNPPSLLFSEDDIIAGKADADIEEFVKEISDLYISKSPLQLNEIKINEVCEFITKSFNAPSFVLDSYPSIIKCQDRAIELTGINKYVVPLLSAGSSSWIAFYLYSLERVKTEYQLEDKDDLISFYKNWLSSGCFSLLSLTRSDGVLHFIASSNPIEVNLDENGMYHHPTKYAYTFSDGTGEYYWHNVLMPNHLYEEPINQSVINSIENIEVRRALWQKLGTEELFKILDVRLKDTDTVHGQKVELWVTNEKDKIIDDYLYMLTYECPSTERKYLSMVAPADNAWEAMISKWDDIIEYAPELEA